jgi:LuxR family maltose regulon positive regulatory protein
MSEQTSFAELKRSIPPSNPLNLFRLRLINHVNEGLGHKLTVISAPAGFGKTTLLSQWASRSPVKVVWLSLDKNDDDPGWFFRNLIACLQTINKNIGKEAFKMLQAEPKPSMEAILKKMTAQAGMVLQEFVLVLDDYHRIESPPVHNMVTFLLDYLPPQMHIFISSETDPPWSLAALRSAGQLKEIRAPYLAFTQDEANAFFNDLLQLKLAYGEISALITRDEALPSRIKYSALCLRQAGQNAADFISSFEGDEREPTAFQLEYLLNVQSSATIRFLRKICLLEYLNAPLCGIITEGVDAVSSEMLQKLADEGLFITAVDAKKQWYSFQPFIKEMLRKQLMETGTENWAGMHQQVGQWFAQSGWMRQAFRHALAAKDYNFAGQIIEQNARDMLQGGELVTVESWLASMPDKVIQSRPLLSICRAWVLIITQRFNEVEKYLKDALSAPGNTPAPDVIINHVNAIQDFLAERESN